MTFPSQDKQVHDESVELLARIVRIMEYWKLTLLYIAIILTIWLVLRVTGHV